MQRFDAAAIKTQACDLARRLGACAVRVADAVPHDQAREAMRTAFARGDFATWPYDDVYAQRATTPQALLSGARSVLCIAVAYATVPPAEGRLQGRVSSYAWSHDYHRRLKKLLREVAGCIDAAAGAAVTAIACDTRPLAERAFAARSGLGWIGKHTNLITPQAGSFVFLGEIVTTLALPLDLPLRKSCGACTRCIPACPTGALRADYTIDATRCISDLTQRKDAIPRAMRPHVGTWVWGCDLCQTACPPNHRAGVRGTASDAPAYPQTASPSLVRLLHLRSSEFKRTFSATAMGWRGAAILRRNAAVALGNALDRSTVGALAQALAGDAHPLVRGHAAWALGRIGSNAALAALADAHRRELDPAVLEEIASALEPFGGIAPLGTV